MVRPPKLDGWLKALGRLEVACRSLFRYDPTPELGCRGRRRRQDTSWGDGGGEKRKRDRDPLQTAVAAAAPTMWPVFFEAASPKRGAPSHGAARREGKEASPAPKARPKPFSSHPIAGSPHERDSLFHSVGPSSTMGGEGNYFSLANHSLGGPATDDLYRPNLVMVRIPVPVVLVSRHGRSRLKRRGEKRGFHGEVLPSATNCALVRPVLFHRLLGLLGPLM